MKYFLHVRMAAIYEDLNSPQKSIELLEELINAPVKLMEDKLFLDLGRLNKVVEKKEKARLNFQYVIDNSMDDETKKLARLFLSEL